MLKLKVSSEKGFTLIEIAIVMVIIGLLAGGGVSLMGMLSERKVRNESADYLNEAKYALISYAKIHGRLPLVDTDNDGYGDSSTQPGTLPYLDLVGLKPKDANSRVIKYALNSSLGVPSTTCSTLRVGLTGSPIVVDSDDVSATPLSVAAVLISAGQKDADNDGNVFDDVTTGTHQGDNTDGIPRYIRYPPNDTFDDLVVYISGNTLCGEICDDLMLDVVNKTGTIIFVFENTQSSDIGAVPPNDTRSIRIHPGQQIELRDAIGGGGSIVPSTPNTPVTIAGSSVAINVPSGYSGDNLMLYVANKSAIPIFVFENTQSSDIGAVPKNDVSQIRVHPGQQIELRDTIGGGGSIVSSTPNNPVTIAGSNVVISVP